MKDYQFNAIISVITALAAAFLAVISYYSFSYMSAVTVFLLIVGLLFVSAFFAVDAFFDYRAARRLERWSAGK